MIILKGYDKTYTPMIKKTLFFLAVLL